jgi:hypothetical protein
VRKVLGKEFRGSHLQECQHLIAWKHSCVIQEFRKEIVDIIEKMNPVRMLVTVWIERHGCLVA